MYKMTASMRMSLSLEGPRQLSEAMGFPERAYPTIHVAGTNGKGSVSTKIARALQFSGLRTGLYTSPHVSTFRERIEINGNMISEEELCQGMEEVMRISEKLEIQPSFFEITTALAFDHYRRQKADVVVVETGLGGRLDATNIVRPLLSIITSISHDHMQILGNTLDEIAKEKAGIIKPRTPVLIGPKADFLPIWRTALELEAPLAMASKIRGDYDAENSSIARSALKLLSTHFPLSQEAIENGLRLRPSCRFEKVGEAILDVAHNPDSFRRLFEALAIHHPRRPVRLILGMSKDKDLASCLKIAAAKTEHIHLVQAPSSRAASPEELAEELNRIGAAHYTKGGSVFQAIGEALEATASLAADERPIAVVCGSFYIMAEAREALGFSVPRDALDLNHLTIKV